jgi:hypothetical protein
MNRPARTLWALAAVAGATAVGITTHEPGFVIITFIGGLWLPRILGLRGRRGGWACGGVSQGRGWSAKERLEAWHRKAHDEAQPPTSATASQA